MLMPTSVLSSTVTRPSRPSVARNAKASGMPAKFDATPENVSVAERIQLGSPPRTIAMAMATPIRAPRIAEARLTLMEIQ